MSLQAEMLQDETGIRIRDTLYTDLILLHVYEIQDLIKQNTTSNIIVLP